MCSILHDRTTGAAAGETPNRDKTEIFVKGDVDKSEYNRIGTNALSLKSPHRTDELQTSTHCQS
jgi:hypothetical protein